MLWESYVIGPVDNLLVLPDKSSIAIMPHIFAEQQLKEN